MPTRITPEAFFNSSLQNASIVASVEPNNTNDTKYIVISQDKDNIKFILALLALTIIGGVIIISLTKKQ